MMVQKAVAAGLAGQPGWEQHPDHDHHFQHLETGVHIRIYRGELAVTFGELAGVPYEKAAIAKTGVYPTLAITSILEVAGALVEVRRLAKWRAEVAAAFEEAFAAGDEPRPGPE
jgi:hypothetical protein